MPGDMSFREPQGHMRFREPQLIMPGHQNISPRSVRPGVRDKAYRQHCTLVNYSGETFAEHD